MSDKMSSNTTRRSIIESVMLLQDPKERIEAYLDTLKSQNFWDSGIMQGVKVISASEGRAEFEFIVTKAMCNAGGTLHGGCAATMLDDLTSVPAITLADPSRLGVGTVSRTLSCTYLRAVQAGEKVRVVCELVGVGKLLGHCRGDLIREDGTIAVSCVHDKAIIRKPKL